MNKLFFVLLIFFFVMSAKASLFSFGENKNSVEDLRSKKWNFDLGLNALNYQAEFPKFEGDFESVGDEKVEIAGINLAIGREFKLTSKIGAIFSLGGFYNKSIIKDTGQAAEDIDLEVSRITNDHSIYGSEAIITFNYSIIINNFLTKPFIELGTGVGNYKGHIHYISDGIDLNDPNDHEDYNVKIEEDFLYTKAFLGVQLAHTSGLLSFFKLGNMQISKNSKEVEGDYKANGGSKTVVSDKSDVEESFSSFSYSLGLGYLF